MESVEPEKRTFTVQIDAAIDAGAYESPGFRFRFLEGSKKATPTISSWSAIASPSDPQEAGDSNPPPTRQMVRFQHAFPDIPITESFAMQLHADPILSFFFFDHPGLVGPAAVAPPGKDAKGAKHAAPASAATTEQAGTPRNGHKAYAGLFEVDVSSMLAGRLAVEHIWGHDDPTSDLVDEESFFAKKPPRDTSSELANLFALPSAAGIKRLAITITVDQPLLTGALLRKLNPITVTIGTCRRLPGVHSNMADASSPHTALAQLCRPAYARVHFFPDKLRSQSSLSSSATASRIILTPGKRQAATITWNCSITMLSAAYNASTLVEALKAGALTVEIHDRDLRQDEYLVRLAEKWEERHRANGDSPPPAHSGDVFTVDEVARADWYATLAQSRRLFAYGQATFRLAEVLHRTLAASQPPNPDGKPYLDLKFSSDIIATKRRASTLGSPTVTPEEDEIANAVELSPMARAVRDPGAYVASGASLSIQVQLQHPLGMDNSAAGKEDRSVGPRLIPPVESSTQTTGLFSRMVLIIPYKDNATLEQVANAMAAVNLAVLPGVSIRSYQMSESEKAATELGEMDVITGAQIIDNDYRTIILEGIATQGMALMYQQLQRQGRNDPNGYRMFANDHLRFTHRLYTAFDIDLKRIKLRYPLLQLLSMPDIYMRTKVSEPCFLALTKLADMRQAEWLADVKALDLFPTVSMLLDIESKYGESITLEDILGRGSRTSSDKAGNALSSQLNGDEHSNGSKNQDSTSKRSSGSTWKAPTDSTNTAYDESRRQRVSKDFIHERLMKSEETQATFNAKKELLDAKTQAQGSAPVYMYSGQKLRTQDALQEEMRQKLAKNRDVTYTYGREFQSLALSLVNPDALRQTEEQEQRKKWTTQRGFVYPAPRNPAEYNKHPHAPSQARREELRQPFVDNVNHPKPVSRNAEGGLRAGAPDFSTLPSKDMVFGGTNGDGTPNMDYFRSVHLCGEGLRQEMEAARRQEKEDWEKRVVVDKKQLKFLAHGNTCSLPRAKPSQLDKIADILNGPARSKPIRIVKNASLPSGKKVALDRTPVTIHNQDEYVGCVADTFASTLRPTDTTHFQDGDTDQPKDFRFPSHTDSLTPPVNRVTTRKEITPVLAAEKQSLLWSNP